LELIFLDTQFDQRFEGIEAINWTPWVGDLYATCRDKVLILGESCYDWGGITAPERLKQKTFTREMVGIAHGLNTKSKEKFFRNFERAILLKKRPNIEARNRFWRSICFHNLVLRHMPNIKIRPSIDDYKNGWRVFFKLVEATKPKICIFAGTDYSKLDTFHEIASEGDILIKRIIWRKRVGYARGTHLQVETSTKHSFSILFIKHPSFSFSWKKWGEYIRENVQLSFVDTSEDNGNNVAC
jgi:hypothetical protein